MSASISLPVPSWSRSARHSSRTLGFRCGLSRSWSAMAELVLALDLPTREEALRLLDRLPALKWVKVGSILMTAEGPGLVRELIRRGLQVFLDLKWHDIPNTVAGAVGAAAKLGVQLATVHASGGAEMLQAASAQAGSVALVGVTVLTSQSATDLPNGVSVADLAEQRARLAMDCGLSGIVCSVQEIQRIRTAVGP